MTGLRERDIPLLQSADTRPGASRNGQTLRAALIGFVRSWRRAAGLFLATAIVFVAVPRELVANRDTERTISIYNIHNKETLTVVYKRDGKYIPSAMKKIDWVMRDWRRNEATKMDPELIDTIWAIHTELGSKRPIHLISGYRSRKTNNSLRRKRGGQARNSRHILGKAADIHFPDIPVRRLRYSGLVRERGGVGYYPTSALPFVHIDTGRVRHWPRMGRTELALLTKGRSKHVPRDGRKLTRADYKRALAKNSKLAKRIAAFHANRGKKRPATTAIASLDTSRPKNWVIPKPNIAARPVKKRKAIRTAALDPAVVPVPQEAERPDANPAVAVPSSRPQRSREIKLKETVLAGLDQSGEADDPALPAPIIPAIPDEGVAGQGEVPPTPDRAPRKPIQVASLTPDAGLGSLQPVRKTPSQPFFELTGWATAPEYDDEHSGELSYRPFPIGPFLTNDPSVDSPVLARLVHPDLKGARDLVGRNEQDIPLRFKPGLQYAEMLWSDIFAGGGVNDLLSSDPALRPWAQDTIVAQQQ